MLYNVNVNDFSIFNAKVTYSTLDSAGWRSNGVDGKVCRGEVILTIQCVRKGVSCMVHLDSMTQPPSMGHGGQYSKISIASSNLQYTGTVSTQTTARVCTFPRVLDALACAESGQRFLVGVNKQ